jgi:RNA polymerase primary sigma factor
MESVHLSETEIAELDEAADRGRARSDEMRERLAGTPAAPHAGAFVAGTLDRHAGVPSPEDALVRAAKAGDQRAREELIERYLPLIVSLARSFRVEDLDFADLIQEGCLGLLRALARFDPDQGTPFGAYATWWIRLSLQEIRSDFVRPFRLPPKALRQLSQLKSEHGRRYAAEGREPRLAELAEGIGIDRDQAEALMTADASVRSLSEPVEAGEGEIGMLGDLLADPLSDDAYEDVLDGIAGEQLRALLSRLTDREHEVIAARFGLGGREPERLVDVAERLGVSVERVRQLEQRALTKLRQSAGATRG